MSSSALRSRPEQRSVRAGLARVRLVRPDATVVLGGPVDIVTAGLARSVGANAATSDPDELLSLLDGQRPLCEWEAFG